MSICKMVRFLIFRLIRGKGRRNTPTYTQKNFEQELNYNLWSTSRIRFAVAKRLKKKHKLSGQTIAFASAYLILLSLLQTYVEEVRLNQLLTYSAISLAIVILVVSQLENASNYSLQAYKHNQCALQINKLYKKLRRLKSEGGKVDGDKLDELSTEFNQILEKYENHEDLDYDLFKIRYKNYIDHRCSLFFRIYKNCYYYLSNKITYHLVIFLTPFVLIFLLCHILGFIQLDWLLNSYN